MLFFAEAEAYLVNTQYQITSGMTYTCYVLFEQLCNAFIRLADIGNYGSDMQSWLQSRRIELPPLTVKTVKCGVIMLKMEFLLNMLLILGTCFLYINADMQSLSN